VSSDNTMRTSHLRQNSLKNCQEQASRDFYAELRIVKLLDQKYYELIEKAQKVEQSSTQIANFALAVRSYRALHCAADNLENGYYEVSLTLLRHVFENLLQMIYFAKFAEEADKWLYRGKKIEQKEIRKKLAMDGSIYKRLSNDYAHSLQLKSMESLTSEGSGTVWIVNAFPIYSSNKCRLCLSCWIDFAWATETQLLHDYKKSLESHGSWIQGVNDVFRASNDCLKLISLDLEKNPPDGLKNTFKDKQAT
jgi:hypothetical protein